MSAADYLDLALSRTELDRAAHLRSDEAKQSALWAQARIALLLGDKFVYRSIGENSGVELRYFSAKEIADLNLSGDRYFLGLTIDDAPYFVFHTQPERD